MNFPFKKSEEYLTAKEKKDLVKFLENEPLVGSIYTKGDEARRVMRIDYPTGAITDKTAFMEDSKTRETYYHTPQATVANSREARVMFMDKKDEWQTTYSGEWLKFVNGAEVFTPLDEIEVNPLAKNIKHAESIFGKPNADFTNLHKELGVDGERKTRDKSEDAKWQTVNRK